MTSILSEIEGLHDLVVDLNGQDCRGLADILRRSLDSFLIPAFLSILAACSALFFVVQMPLFLSHALSSPRASELEMPCFDPLTPMSGRDYPEPWNYDDFHHSTK